MSDTISPPTTELGALTVRTAHMDDIDAIMGLHLIAFADKFGGAFGSEHSTKGAEAIATAWRRQGPRSLRGMWVAEIAGQVVGTASLRTADMGVDDPRSTEIAFQQVLGGWGALRSLFVLSILDHQIGRDEGFITDVAVAEGYRRRGIARKLLARLEEDARMRYKQSLGLYVSAANSNARTLYFDLGFVDVRTYRSWLARWFYGQRSWKYMRKDLH